MALGKEPGGVIRPVLVNIAPVSAIFGVAWLASGRQEL